MTLHQKRLALQKLSQKIASCRRCPLYKNANPVPGEGNPDAAIMFIGEAPGFHENHLGRPFVGASGQLLEQSLNQIGLKRADVFIANILRHRPPGNRDPLPAEVKACQIHLNTQIKIISPLIIATLGRFALSKFLPSSYISHVHGQPRPISWDKKSFTLLPLYHPSAALRDTRISQEFQADFLKLKQLISPLERSSENSSSTDTQLPLL